MVLIGIAAARVLANMKRIRSNDNEPQERQIDCEPENTASSEPQSGQVERKNGLPDKPACGCGADPVIVRRPRV